MLKLQMNAMEKKIEAMSADMTLMRAFIEQKFPGEDWRNIVVAEQNKEVSVTVHHLPLSKDQLTNTLCDQYICMDYAFFAG